MGGEKEGYSSDEMNQNLRDVGSKAKFVWLYVSKSGHTTSATPTASFSTLASVPKMFRVGTATAAQQTRAPIRLFGNKAAHFFGEVPKTRQELGPV